MANAQPVVAVLDDEPEMRKALRRLLTFRGFRVQECEGGQDLLAAIGLQRPDCLLLDSYMPGCSGFEVLEALQSWQIAVPVIVITAHDEPDTTERAAALGVSADLKKPVDRETLLSAIQVAMSHEKAYTLPRAARRQ